jgi:hypothetical protein
MKRNMKLSALTETELAAVAGCGMFSAFLGYSDDCKQGAAAAGDAAYQAALSRGADNADAGSYEDRIIDDFFANDLSCQ